MSIGPRIKLDQLFLRNIMSRGLMKAHRLKKHLAYIWFIALIVTKKKSKLQVFVFIEKIKGLKVEDVNLCRTLKIKAIFNRGSTVWSL